MSESATPKKKRVQRFSKTNVDYDQVREFAKLQATQREISAVLRIPYNEFRYDEKLKEAYEDGLREGGHGIRRKQYEVAMAGNVTMLIWLGKQYLGQRDQQHVEATGSVRFEVVNYATGGK